MFADRGRDDALVCATPPSEPDGRISRIRLSSRCFPACARLRRSLGRTSGCPVGDLTQRDQPLGSQPGIWVTVVIQSTAASSSASSPAQDAAQALPYPLLQLLRHVAYS